MNFDNDFTQGLSLWQKVVFRIFLGVLYTFSLLPLKVLYIFSDGLYFLIYYVVGYRKKVVRKNLRESFPEKSDAELLTIEKKFYHFFCDYIYETIKLTSMSKDEMRKRVTYSGLEHMNKYLADGHNVALYIAHYSNWEWVTSIGLHKPDEVVVGQVYHILNSKVFNSIILYIRSKMGTYSVSMQLILRWIVQSRRDGIQLIVGFISDQVPLVQSTHHYIDFLNHEGTTVITGTEKIAKQCDFSCVYLDMSRPKRGYYHIEVIPMIEEPKEAPDFELTEQYFRMLEKTIQRQPELWLWSHNRWKRTMEDFCRWAETDKNVSENQKKLAEEYRKRKEVKSK